MRVSDKSLSIYGTQIVVETYNRDYQEDTILPNHPSWPRYAAMARLLAREHRIEEPFVRADVKSIGYITETQFSYRRNDNDIGS